MYIRYIHSVQHTYMKIILKEHHSILRTYIGLTYIWAHRGLHTVIGTIPRCHEHETCPAHWVIVLHLGLEGCSQPMELWFIDILMYIQYMYIHSHTHMVAAHSLISFSRCAHSFLSCSSIMSLRRSI